MYQFLVHFLKSFILSYNPPLWIKYYHRMPYYIWAAFRGLLSYYLIVLFSYFQSLGRFLGALYHIIIGLFWGAFFLLSYYHWVAFWHLLSYCSIIIGPILVGFFLIVLLSFGLLLGDLFLIVLLSLGLL